MADQDDASERSEDPTQKRLDDAHDRGDVAKSQEVNTWFMIAGATLVGCVVVASVVDRRQIRAQSPERAIEGARPLDKVGGFRLIRQQRYLMLIALMIVFLNIVNTSSLFGLHAIPSQSTYNATKFAVRGFTEALREELERTTRDALAGADAELEGHSQERRRALDELAERLRRRERSVAEHIEHEEAEAVQRIQAGFAEVERRQVEALERAVERSSTRFAEAASQLFADEIKAAREGAAQRLSRELDRAVQAFLREAEALLRERVQQVGDTGAQRLEKRLSQVATALERQRDEALASLGRKVEEAEASFRRSLQTFAADAEAERGIVEARVHELSRRIEETLSHAQERVASGGPTI